MAIDDITPRILELKSRGLKVVGYCRESKKGADYLAALGNHVDDLKHCHCDRVCAELVSAYRDVERPMFNRVLSWLRSGKYQVLVVPTLARFGRRAQKNLALINEFNKAGIHIFAIDEGYLSGDTTEAFNIIGTGSLQAEMESRRISDRSRKGKRGTRRRAEPGCGRPAFGLMRVMKNGKKRLAPDPEKAELCEGLARIFVEEQGSLIRTERRIFDELGLRMAKSSIRSWIRNPHLRGHTYYPKTGQTHYHTHQPVLGQDLLAEIDQIIEDRKWYKGKNSHTPYNPLARKCVCHHCKRIMQRKTDGHYNYIRHRPVRPGEQKCNSKNYAYYEDVIAAVDDALRRHAHEIVSDLVASDQNFQPSKALKQKESQLAELKKAYQLGKYNALKEAIEALEVEVLQMRQRERDRTVIDKNKAELIDIISMPLFWEEVTEDERRQIYRDLVRQVVLKDGRVESVEFLI